MNFRMPTAPCKVLTGSLGGIEKMEGGGTIAVIYYKEMRVVIPLAEMMINLVEMKPITTGNWFRDRIRFSEICSDVKLTLSSRDLTMLAAA